MAMIPKPERAKAIIIKLPARFPNFERFNTRCKLCALGYRAHTSRDGSHRHTVVLHCGSGPLRKEPNE